MHIFLLGIPKFAYRGDPALSATFELPMAREHHLINKTAHKLSFSLAESCRGTARGTAAIRAPARAKRPTPGDRRRKEASLKIKK